MRYIAVVILISTVAVLVACCWHPAPRVSPESDSGDVLVETLNLAQFDLAAAQSSLHDLWELLDDPAHRELAATTAKRLQDSGAMLGRAIDMRAQDE